MGMEIPFDVANIPGPEMGEVAPPEVIGNYISRAKRPLLVVGSEILRDDFFLETAIEIGKKGIPIAATGHSIRGFVEKGYTENVNYCNLHELTNCLRDPNWKGLDGKGNYDFVIFFGIVYYYASQMLSCIKNFAIDPLIRAVSIDRYYHPQARMSFTNISPKMEAEYKDMLNRLVSSIKRRGGQES
ncbi:MAG: CO dehydrogenase/acetyl-CoA synthase complex subunit epsilon [Methanophagales archaeon]|nr:CO dehydrogenase/acetyl-CoA synthase complex subunit epsilon [Methanophagales archaeon]